MDKERRADLEDAVAEMRLLDEMVKTAGWQKVIVPAYTRLRESFMADLLEAKDLPSMFKAQAEIKSVNLLIRDINRRIQEGKEAVEALSKEKEKEENA